MVKRTSSYLVSWACVVMALGACCFNGCKPEESVQTPTAQTHVDPPSVYMKDPIFIKALGEKRAERVAVLTARDGILQKLEDRISAMRAAMPGASDEAIRLELEKDPDWTSLVKRLESANQAFEENRVATTKVVSERLTRKTK